MVSFNIDINFKTPPIATKTDKLEDTVCYLQIVQSIKKLCHNKRFNLIESLAYDVYNTIILNHNTEAKVTVHKLSPPVPGIHGGVMFTYSGDPK